MIKILIADDHAIVRRGMKQLLHEHFPFSVIGEVANSEELLREVKKEEWDVVICDINMPGQSGLIALQQIRDIFPDLPVLIMSMYPEDQYALRVFKAGASGFLGKETIHDDLIYAIETVRSGKKFITTSLAQRLAETIDKDKTKIAHETLSDREFEVFKQLAVGKPISEIASLLSLSSTTVSTYRSRILEKMKMKSNAELAIYARENNLI